VERWRPSLGRVAVDFELLTYETRHITVQLNELSRIPRRDQDETGPQRGYPGRMVKAGELVGAAEVR